MNTFKASLSILAVFALTVLALPLLPTAAQDDQPTPSVTVSDQLVFDGHVVVDTVVSAGSGWMVIHADNGEGAPGPVIGFAQVNSGVNYNISVPHDSVTDVEGAATDQIFPMLHYDTGEIGVYEFGQVEGADGPVRVNESVVVGPLEITAE
jgi:hypothetical protein